MFYQVKEYTVMEYMNIINLTNISMYIYQGIMDHYNQ